MSASNSSDARFGDTGAVEVRCMGAVDWTFGKDSVGRDCLIIEDLIPCVAIISSSE